MTTKEIWKSVPNCNGCYQASNMGRVRSLDRTLIDKNGRKRVLKGKYIKGCINKDGYKKTILKKDGVSKTLTIPQIIAITFLGHKPNGNKLVIDHRNGIKTDDRLENLRVVTQRENLSDCIRSDRKTLSSKYSGVSWHGLASKWRVKIVFNYVDVYLGLFIDELDASNAYQKALYKIKDGTFDPEDYK